MARVELAATFERSILLAGEPVTYTLNRKRGRRNVGMRIDERGLTINAPLSVSVKRIDAFIEAHARWVRDKLAYWRARHVPAIAWREGEALPFLGEALWLAPGFHLGPERVHRVWDELRVACHPGDTRLVATLVVDWYKLQATQHFSDRLLALCARHAPPRAPRLTLSSARARWGSCSPDGEIRLNWRLVKAEREVIDYVILHELAHLSEMNHGPRFWRLVEHYCPDYRALKARLEEREPHYRTF